MILTRFDYARPASVGEAVALLEATGGLPLGGGQSLLVGLATGETETPILVDLSTIDELRGITPGAAGGGLRVGASTTLSELASDPEVLRLAPALAEAARANDDAQVRNRATVGGNLVADRPGPARATDLPVAAVALGATVTVADASGRRTVPAELLGSVLTPSAVVVALEIPPGGEVSGFEKWADRATRFPMCAVAVRVDRAAGTCGVAVTAATPAPIRLPGVESRLAGGARPTIREVITAVTAEPITTFRSGHGASAEYLRHLTGVLAGRALHRSWR
ncbi:FAD binding domain-containing protein [Streptacidiphilus rugosus]|uniref:FAD binding domain-containing protein n=1 Tax=Streptacidiphilus rugosus TaxID=405783 RepID=UPI000689B9B9|nr:FAD binding domain-containing protein [Streptacidiphilus rugosus]